MHALLASLTGASYSMNVLVHSKIASLRASKGVVVAQPPRNSSTNAINVICFMPLTSWYCVEEYLIQARGVPIMKSANNQ